MGDTDFVSFHSRMSRGDGVTAALCLIVMVLLSWLSHPTPLEAAQAQNLATAATGDCAACHGGDAMVPADHAATKGLTLPQCLSCHKGNDPELINTMPLSHAHQLSGVTCTKCHGETQPPAAVTTKTCVVCHPIADLIEKTKTIKEGYPHNSHYGPNLACEKCHHAHKKSEVYCNQCHSFDFVVPSPILKPAGKTAPAVRKGAPAEQKKP
ncbi:MAG: cytochrome c3 family protein [Syntrophaceae bacterium]|nr:cytochrome c3 family protein [Deltaproteobacteria bacterium]